MAGIYSETSRNAPDFWPGQNSWSGFLWLTCLSSYTWNFQQEWKKKTHTKKETTKKETVVSSNHMNI